jgi:dTDP-glucose 4,6-dehydratase
MYVDDHVDAYVRALEKKGAVGHVFNVSPGNPCTNLALAEKVAKLVGFKGVINRGSYPPGYPMRPASWDTDYIVLNSDLIRSNLGWKPSMTLDQGLRQVVEMWRRSEARGVERDQTSHK